MTAHNPPIRVAFVCDERYAMPLAVALASVRASLPPHQQLIAHVLESGFTPALREQIGVSLGDDGDDLHWHPVDVAHFASLQNTVRSFDQVTLASYFRVLLARCLPEHVTRVIYLDCDLVVDKDLTPLWAEELDGHLLAAAPESGPDAQYAGAPAGIPLFRELGLAPNLGLFNAGVMVLDLSRWRAEHVAERCLSYLQAAGQAVLWHDQEALNVIAAGDWKPLDPRWNVMMHAFRGNHAEAASESLRRDPWILHFNSARKPWQPGFSLGGAERFFHHLDRTAWAGWRPAPSGILSRAKTVTIRAVLKRVSRAGRAARRLMGALRARAKTRRLLGSRMRLLSGDSVPSAGAGREIRAMLVLADPSRCRVVSDELLRRGAHRVLAATPGPAPNCVGRPVHLYRWDPGCHSSAEMLALLLREHGDEHWCVLPENPATLGELADCSESSELSALDKEVARLEAAGADALLCTSQTDDAFVCIDGFATDLLTGRLFRGVTLVEPRSGRAVSRLALVRGRAGLRVATDFSTASGIHPAHPALPLARHQAPP